ncbi:hypothetical protein FRC11_014193, partial [Ceratobasidium sp. 423]
EELINMFRSAGGKIGAFDAKDPDELHHARRAIAKYLLPGPFRVWYASLDGHDGMVFFIGKPDCLDLRESVNVDLATRCYTLFHRPPDPCEYAENSYGHEYDLIEKRNGKLHSLRLIEVLQYVLDILSIRKYFEFCNIAFDRSSRFEDHYPLREYEIPPHQRHLMQKA